MICQVFDEASTWRGHMKKLARYIAVQPLAYGNQLQPQLDEGFNQMHYAQEVDEGVDALLDRGTYLKASQRDVEVFFLSTNDLSKLELMHSY